MANTNLVKDDMPASRAPRSSADNGRVSDSGTAIPDSEMEHMLRSEFRKEVLPRGRDMPGWHLCWLSETSSYDPIHSRMRLGYVPVKFEEFGGEELSRYKDQQGQFSGCVRMNEMILFKIRQDRYDQIDRYYGHKMPLESEEAIRANIVTNGGQDRNGRNLVQVADDADEESGFSSLGDERARSTIPMQTRM